MKCRYLFVCALVMSSRAIAVTPPVLEKSPATICKLNNEDTSQEWQPTFAQIQELEVAMESYFSKLPESAANLPAPNFIYSRQYEGVVQDGRKLIRGRFYPASESHGKFFKDGDCWITVDGGNRNWNLFFDPKTRRVISHRVNGIA